MRNRPALPRITRRGAEPSGHLSRHRWVVVRTMSWLNGCRRLRIAATNAPPTLLAFVGCVCTLIEGYLAKTGLNLEPP